MATNNLRVFSSNYNFKRKTLKEYAKLHKQELLWTIHSLFANYDKLKNKHIDRLLEVEYMKRRIEQLEHRLDMLNRHNNHHSFRNIKKTKKTITRYSIAANPSPPPAPSIINVNTFHVFKGV